MENGKSNPNSTATITTTPTTTTTTTVVPEALPVVGDSEDQGWGPDPDGAAPLLWVTRADLRVHRRGRDGGAVPPAGDHGVAHGFFVDDVGQEVPPGHGRLDPWFLYGGSVGLALFAAAAYWLYIICCLLVVLQRLVFCRGYIVVSDA